MDGYLAEGFHTGERERIGVSRKGEAGVFEERICVNVSRIGMLGCFMIGC